MAENRQAKRTPVTLKIKFKSASLDEFIERYSVDVSHGGIFIRTKDPLPVGTTMRFEFQLKDASPLIAGEGTVVWTREHDPNRAGVAPGMGVRFDRLADGSQQVLDQILSRKGGKAGSSASMRAFTDVPTRVAPKPVLAGLAKESVKTAITRISPNPASGANQFGDERTDSTPLPPAVPFHSDADDFPEEAFEEATKVRSLDDLVAASALPDDVLLRRGPLPTPPAADMVDDDDDGFGESSIDQTRELPKPSASTSAMSLKKLQPISAEDEDEVTTQAASSQLNLVAAGAAAAGAGAAASAADKAAAASALVDELAMRRAAKQRPQDADEAGEDPEAQTHDASAAADAGAADQAASEAPAASEASDDDRGQPAPVEEDDQDEIEEPTAARAKMLPTSGVSVASAAATTKMTATEYPGPAKPPSSEMSSTTMALALVAAILLLVVAVAGYFLFIRGKGGAGTTDPAAATAADTAPAAAVTPPTPPVAPAAAIDAAVEPAVAATPDAAPTEAIEPPAVPEGPTKEIELRVTPSGATVELVGGSQSGPAPFKLTLAENQTHQVRISMTGYVTQEITVDPKARRQPKIELVPYPYVLKLRSTPEDASVYVDGRRVPATTPNEFTLPAGWNKKSRFKVSFRKSGYEKLDITVEIGEFAQEGEAMVKSLEGTLAEQQKPALAPAGSGSSSGSTSSSSSSGSDSGSDSGGGSQPAGDSAQGSSGDSGSGDATKPDSEPAPAPTPAPEEKATEPTAPAPQ